MADNTRHMRLMNI